VLNWCGWLRPLPDLLTPDNDAVLHATEAEWAPEPVCMGAQYFDPPEFDTQTFQPDYSFPAHERLDEKF